MRKIQFSKQAELLVINVVNFRSKVAQSERLEGRTTQSISESEPNGKRTEHVEAEQLREAVSRSKANKCVTRTSEAA